QHAQGVRLSSQQISGRCRKVPPFCFVALAIRPRHCEEHSDEAIQRGDVRHWIAAPPSGGSQ
ncbi:MAG: hypothetical protein U0975_07495, partial [Erythrobacter sp.]|nr:hypothetical protein [Erythrobacter sp.]